MSTYRRDFSYFLRLTPGGGAPIGQSNVLDIQAPPSPTPKATTWKILSIVQNGQTTELNPAHFTIVEVGVDLDVEMTIDPAFYQDLVLPDASTYVRVELEFDFEIGTFLGTSSRPIQIYPRLIESHEFLHIEGATQSSQSLNAGPIFEDIDYSWSVIIPAGGVLDPGGGATPADITFTTALDGQEATLSVNSSPDWNVDAPVTLRIESQPHDGVRSVGEFPGIISLRTPATTSAGVIDGFTYWRQQTAPGGQGLNAALPGGTVATVSNLGGSLPGDTVIVLDDTLALTAVSSVGGFVYTESGSFDLEFALGVRPTCVWAGIGLNIRELDTTNPFSIDLEFEDAAGMVTVLATGAESWDFSPLVPTGGASTISALGTVNAIELSWAQHALDPGSVGALEVSAQRLDGTHPVSTFTIPLTIGTPLQGEIFFSTDAATAAPITSLHPGRERMRWRDVVHLKNPDGSLHAGVGPGEVLEFFVTSGPPIEFAIASKEDLDPDESQNVLQTSSSVPADQFLPADWAASSPQTITVRAVLRGSSGGTILAGGNDVELSLVVEPTTDVVNVAILLDRSGSMGWFGRWPAAISGAHWFSAQIALNNQDPAITVDHKVGVFWFAGKGADATVSNYPTIQPLGSAGASYGTLEDAGTPLGFTNFLPQATGDAWLVNLGNTTTSVTPQGWTAAGAGLLHARDMLMAEDVSADAQRVILALSDGHENRAPLIAAGGGLFDGGIIWDDAGAPNTRIYSCALQTTDNWVDVLREASDATGGIGELDVKHLLDTATVATDIPAWFQSNFAQLTGFTPIVAPPDPSLGSGDMDSYPAEVTHGHSKLIFNLFQGAVGTEDEWELFIEPPSAAGEIGSTLDLAALEAMDGVQVIKGPMYRSVVISLPLNLAGQGFRWAGTWQMHVTRTGPGTVSYAASVLAREDVGTRIVVDAPPRPSVGDQVCVRAFVAEGEIDAEQVLATTTVRAPQAWRGELLADLISDAESPVPGEDVDGDEDKDDDVDLRQDLSNVVQDSFDDELEPREFSLRLDKVSEGVYEGCFVVDAPGAWSLDTRVRGYRAGALAREISSKIHGRLKAEVVKGLRGRARSSALHSLSTGAGTQVFSTEERTSLGVRFVANRRLSEPRGFFRKAKVLRLSVRPVAKDGTLLGPGWAPRIRFTGHRRVRRFEVHDAGTGTYWVDLELEGKGKFHHSGGWVSAANLSMVSAASHFALPTGRLNLRTWGVEVLGHWMPLEIKGRLTPLKGRDPHLLLGSTSLLELVDGKVKALTSKDKAERAVLGKLLEVLDASVGLDMPVRPSTHAGWVHGLRLSLAATERAVNQIETKADIASLSVLADALERALVRAQDLGRADFARAADDFDALVEAVAALGQTH